MQAPSRLPVSLLIRWILDRPVVAFLGVVLPTFILVLLITGHAMMYLFLDQTVRSRELRQHGKLVDGTVLACAIDQSIVINGHHPVRITYRFRSEDGASCQDHMLTLDRMTARAFRAGDPLKILHWEGRSMIEGVAPLAIPRWPFVLAYGLVLLVSTPFLTLSIRSVLLKWRLHRTGAVATGLVSAIRPQWALLPLGQRYECRYTFRPAGGDEVIEGASTVTFDTIKNAQEGGTISVLYDLTRPARSCVREVTV